MNNTQKRTLRRIIIEAALLLLLLPLQARAAEYKCTAELPVEVRTSGAATAERFTITLTPEDGAPAPAADTVQAKGSGTASSTGLTYTAPGVHGYGTGDQPAERRPGGRDLGHGRQQRKDRPAAVPEPVRPARRADAHACPGQNHPGPRAPRAQARPAPNRRSHAGDPAGRAGRALCRWANGSIL